MPAVLDLDFNFNPLPPHGGRRAFRKGSGYIRTISIHSLRMEGDLTVCVLQSTSNIFQSTPSAWRETGWQDLVGDPFPISIHSLRMEGDHTSGTSLWKSPYFNPLPPHGGRRVHTVVEPYVLLFQSTPSAWRETACSGSCAGGFVISIHSLRMEGDLRMILGILLYPTNFNPLPPHGGRRIVLFWIAVLWHFNPLPPHGGRLQLQALCVGHF